MARAACRLPGVAVALALASAASADAQEGIRIGIVGSFTGPFATAGEGFKRGVESFLAIQGNSVGGRKVEVRYRDSIGNPSTAKQLTEELIVRDRVSILGGFTLTPGGAAVAPLVNEAKVPLLLFNAATPSLLGMSPYYVRMGQNITQPAELGAIWGREIGKSRGYTAVAD
jgi:branched-chain amino acid transport system substrate-binding protein